MEEPIPGQPYRRKKREGGEYIYAFGLLEFAVWLATIIGERSKPTVCSWHLRVSIIMYGPGKRP